MAPPNYTNVPASTDTFVFAQLCTETSSADVEKSTVINLYDNSSNVAPLDIDGSEFMEIFYPNGRDFEINCDGPTTSYKTMDGGDFMRLDSWVRAADAARGVDGHELPSPTDSSGHQFELVPEVLEQWSRDLGVDKDCWTPCSVLNITKELLRANYICNCSVNVCCSVSALELAQALNARSNEGSTLAGAQYDGRSADKPVIKDDKLALSLLFTNPNTGVKPIDLRLNFNIAKGL